MCLLYAIAAIVCNLMRRSGAIRGRIVGLGRFPHQTWTDRSSTVGCARTAHQFALYPPYRHNVR